MHDSHVFEEWLEPSNRCRSVWADSAYRSQETLDNLQKLGYREHIQRKGSRRRQLTNWDQRGNRTRSKVRSRVEFSLDIQANILNIKRERRFYNHEKVVV